MDRFVQAVRRLGGTRAFAWFGARVAPRVDRLVHRLTRGRRTAAQLFLPTLLLTTTGRRTGQPRVQPVSYVQRDGVRYVVGTNWGGDEHPGWTWNLLAQPAATVSVDGRTVPVRARLLDADERAALWPDFVAMWPAYETYVSRTDRDIRMFALEPRQP